MTSRDYNPFTQLELRLPIAFQEEIRRYTRTQDTSATGRGSRVEESPFSRYVDFWITAIAVAVSNEANVQVPSTTETWRFEYGARLQGSTAWIDLLQLIAISHDGDPLVLREPRRVIDIANSYAAAGTESLINMLAGGEVPLWNVTTALMKKIDSIQPDAPDELAESIGLPVPS